MKHNSGFSLLWVLGITAIASVFLMIGFEKMTASAHLQRRLELVDAHSEVSRIVEKVLWEHYNYALSHDFSQVNTRERIAQKLAWALPSSLKIMNFGFSKFSKPPFETLSAPLTQESLFEAHPLDQALGYTLSQEFFLTYSLAENPQDYSLVLKTIFREIPTTEVQFVSNATMSPRNSDVAIHVEGITLAPGFIDTFLGSPLSSDIFIGKFFHVLEAEKPSKVHFKHRYLSPKLAYGYGYEFFNYLLRDSHVPYFKEQSCIIKSDMLMVNFDGERVLPVLAGLSVREFNQGPKRLVIDTSLLLENNLFINGINETAVRNGIVIIGNSSQHHPKIIITNSRVWLWGNNTGSPVCVGTTFGEWTFLDNTWTELSGSGKPLNLIWEGYLISPANTSLFSSPQSSAKNGTLTLQGTLLVGGSIGGNLKQINIHRKPQDASFSKTKERFLMPIKIEKAHAL